MPVDVSGLTSVVTVVVTGYGHTGPWADRPGYDLAVQGQSGIMSLTGDPNGPPPGRLSLVTPVAKTKDASLETIFQELHRLLLKHVPPFKPGGDERGMFRGKKNFHLVVPEPVAIPGAYGGKPTELCMASVVLQKGAEALAGASEAAQGQDLLPRQEARRDAARRHRGRADSGHEGIPGPALGMRAGT
jgi:hypothetical protein